MEGVGRGLRSCRCRSHGGFLGKPPPLLNGVTEERREGVDKGGEKNVVAVVVAVGVAAAAVEEPRLPYVKRGKAVGVAELQMC